MRCLVSIYSDIISTPRDIAAYVQQYGAGQLVSQLNHLAPHNQTHFERVLSVYQACSQNLTENLRKSFCSFFVKGLLGKEVLALPNERINRLRQSGIDLTDMIKRSNCSLLEKREAYRYVTFLNKI